MRERSQPGGSSLRNRYIARSRCKVQITHGTNLLGIHRNIADGRKNHIVGACNIAIGLLPNNGNGALHHNITAGLKGNSINSATRTSRNRGGKGRSITIDEYIFKRTASALAKGTNRNTTGISES